MTAARSAGATNANKLRALRGQRARLQSQGQLVKFTARVVQDVIDGSVAVGVARTALYGVSIQRQLIESSELEERITALEARMAERDRGGPQRAA